jgi:cobalt-zinc-cadmium efflux system outer membrane protein
MAKVGLIVLVALLSSCSAVLTDSEAEVAVSVQERIGKEVVWGKSCRPFIETLLAEPLRVESAIQIALLNNPEIQALFEEIGMAEADLIEAGLFSNPVFELDVRYPHNRSLRTNIEYLVTAAFLDVFLIPLRKKLAEAELEQAKLRVTEGVLNLAFDVRQAYYEWIAASGKQVLAREVADLVDLQREIVLRQKSAGNIYDLDEAERKLRGLKIALEVEKSYRETILLSEKLHRLLGLEEEVCLQVPEDEGDVGPEMSFDVACLEERALQDRVEVQLAQFELIRIGRRLGLKEGWTYTDLQVGVAGERETDGDNIVGFGIRGKVPLFNSGQAARAHLWAELRQAQGRLAALKIRVVSEVREAYKILMKEQILAHTYRETILPTEKRVLSVSENLYHVMGLGIDTLLMRKEQEMQTRRDYMDSLKNYRVAFLRLERALGGYLCR